MFEVLFGLLGLVLALLILIGFFLPWFQRRQIRDLKEQVEALNARLDRLHNEKLFAAPVQPPAAEPTPPPQPASVPAAPAVVTTKPAVTYVTEPPIEIEECAAAAPTAKGPGFEQQFGAKLPVWIGGIALALAGFYFVRYSIEIGLLSPAVRTFLGILFGGGLIAAAYKVGPHQARIGQALAGAGIADLYICLFAATSLYDLIPGLLGFIGMIGVTALAMVMALRHGMPIAVMGLVGGFITPLLVGSTSPNVPLLLTYLYILFTALLWLIRKNQWWVLALLLAPFALLWVVFLLFTAPADEAFFIALFLLAMGASVAALTRQSTGTELAAQMWGISAKAAISGLTYMVIGFGAVMVGVATAKGGFGWMDRGLLLALIAGGLGLAWFDYARYRLLPWLTLLVGLFTLASWESADALDVRLTFALFAMLQAAVPAWLLWRSAQPLYWALLSAVGITGYYLLAYARMGWEVDRITLWPFIEPKFWGALALLIALAAVLMAKRVYRLSWTSEDLRQKLLAVFAATATGFIALGLTIELEREFLSVALAAQVAALAWLNGRFNVTALRTLTGVAAVAFLLLLLPQVVLLVQLSFYSLFEARLNLLESLPLVNWPFFQLGIPAALLLTAAWWLREQRDDKLVKALEVGSIALLGVMGYYLMRHAFHPGENVLFAAKAGFTERGTFTNVLLLFGLLCVYLGARYGRTAVAQTGVVVCLAGMFRLVWFDLLLDNPAFDRTQLVGQTPLLNALALTYLLPLLWLQGLRLQLAGLSWSRGKRALPVFMGLLAFAFANLTVRHLFHGDPMAHTAASNAELYTYSALWLVIAIGLLVEGTRRRLKAVRIAALVLMVVTVGKVFLVDADELTGLWRVFSFLGLGLCLIGLSWFYNRFVSRTDAQ